MKRRVLLASVGTLSTLAGCNGQTTKTDAEPSKTSENTKTDTESSKTGEKEGNPYFEDVSITGPETIKVGSEFTLTIEATNTGSRSGEFATQITANPQAFTDQSYSVNIPEIPPGESRSTDLGPLVPQVAGEFRFISGNYSAEHSLTVDSLNGDLGDTLKLPNNIAITVESIEISRAYFGKNSDWPTLYKPDDGRCLVLIYLSAENTGSEPARLPTSSSFGIVSGEQISGSTILSPDIEVSGDSYNGGDEIAAGQSRSGWLLFEPRDTIIENGPQLGIAHGGGRPGEAYWSLGDVSKGAEPPSFSIDTRNEPIESTIENELTADITNNGELNGIYRDVLEVRKANRDEVLTRVPIEQEVSAGTTSTWTGTVSIDWVGQTDAELASQGAWGSLDVIAAQLKMGEMFTTSTGIEIRVSDFRRTLGDDVTYKVDDTSHTASPSGQFFLARVETTNAGEEQPLPSVSDFIAQSSEYDTSEPYYIGEEVHLTDPVDGNGYTIYGDSPKRNPGASHSGYLIFDVPRNASFDDLVVRWDSVTRDVNGEAEWHR